MKDFYIKNKEDIFAYVFLLFYFVVFVNFMAATLYFWIKL